MNLVVAFFKDKTFLVRLSAALFISFEHDTCRRSKRVTIAQRDIVCLRMVSF